LLKKKSQNHRNQIKKIILIYFLADKRERKNLGRINLVLLLEKYKNAISENSKSEQLLNDENISDSK